MVDLDKLITDSLLAQHKMQEGDSKVAAKQFLGTLQDTPNALEDFYVPFLLENKKPTDSDYLFIFVVARAVDWDNVTSLLTDALERIVIGSDALDDEDIRNDTPA